MNQRIVVICGPTAVGKTGFAIDLAQRCEAEIVGADSMQVYKYLDIGTAKPDARELAMVPHHLVSVIDPAEDFDAARYADMADAAIADIVSRGRIPIVAGGTGLYIKALLHGLFRGRPADPEVISKYEKLAEEKGNDWLHGLLEDRDPEAAERFHPNDRFRVIRALEVLESTGASITAFQENHGFTPVRYDCLKIGLFMDRQVLYQRIDSRVDIMMNQGLLEEVQGLIQQGYSCGLKPMKSIGYRHVCDYLFGGVPWEETIRLLKRDTRRYAKRQFTWFNADPDIVWFEPGQTNSAWEQVRRFIEN